MNIAALPKETNTHTQRDTMRGAGVYIARWGTQKCGKNCIWNYEKKVNNNKQKKNSMKVIKTTHDLCTDTENL